MYLYNMRARSYVRCPRGPRCPGLDTNYLPTLYFIALGSSVKKKKKREIFPLEQHGCILQKTSCSKCSHEQSIAEAEAVKRTLTTGPSNGRWADRLIKRRLGCCSRPAKRPNNTRLLGRGACTPMVTEELHFCAVAICWLSLLLG